MLNKLRYHTHFWFSANQITWSKLLTEIHILNGKQCRSRSVGFFRSQLIWIYTVCKGRVYPHSAGQGLSTGLIGSLSKEDAPCYMLQNKVSEKETICICRSLFFEEKQENIISLFAYNYDQEKGGNFLQRNFPVIGFCHPVDFCSSALLIWWQFVLIWKQSSFKAFIPLVSI